MRLNAVLMCRDQESLRMLVSALDELAIEEEVCLSEAEALELMALDTIRHWWWMPGASQLARMARLAPAQRRPVVFAMIDDRTDIGSTFQVGANFVLYKPLVCDQMMRSLPAGRVPCCPTEENPHG